MKNVFENESYKTLKILYNVILQKRKEGLRPNYLDKYIKEVQNTYLLDTGEAWRYVENMFWEEVGRRYFSNNKYVLKHSINTKVKIRSDLEEGKQYGGYTFTPLMKDYKGKDARIIDVDYNNLTYRLDIDGRFWLWTDEMFEIVE